MLYPPGLTKFAFTYDNFGNPDTTPGTSVTPGASNAEGSWTQVASSANIAHDVYGFFLRVTGGLGANKPQLLDVGVDPAGGTSYVAIISNLVMGASAGATNTGGGHSFLFPFYIKAGSSVAVRIQGSNATAGTVTVGMKFYGKPDQPDAMPVGSFSQTMGTITNSSGPTLTPGNGAYGSYVDLGTTTQPMWWWQIGYQIDNATITAEYTYIELSYGGASNKHPIMLIQHGGTTSESCGTLIPGNVNVFEAYCPVPAGANIYVRAFCQNAPDTGYNAVAIGIGG